MEKLLYTVDETAELLSVGRCKIYELFNEGQLYSVKVGKSRRVPAIAIDRFLAALGVEPLVPRWRRWVPSARHDDPPGVFRPARVGSS